MRRFLFRQESGTTDDATKEIVPSALEAVRKLQQAGHFVSLATGRANYKAEGFRAKHDFQNMVCNGGHGIYYDGELRENRPLDYDKALAVYRQAVELGYGVLAAIDDSQKVYADSFRFYEMAGIRREATTYIIDEEFDPADVENIYKLYVAVPQEEEHRLTLKDTVGHLRYQKEYLMFQADEKKDGIIKMLEYAGGSPENTVVFGDDYNDLCMLTEKNIEDGIYKACEKHGWF